MKKREKARRLMDRVKDLASKVDSLGLDPMGELKGDVDRKMKDTMDLVNQNLRNRSRRMPDIDEVSGDDEWEDDYVPGAVEHKLTKS